MKKQYIFLIVLFIFFHIENTGGQNRRIVSCGTIKFEKRLALKRS
jgi:hypothetical protein